MASPRWFKWNLDFDLDPDFRRLVKAYGGRTDLAIGLLIRAIRLGCRGVTDTSILTEMLGRKQVERLVQAGYLVGGSWDQAGRYLGGIWDLTRWYLPPSSGISHPKTTETLENFNFAHRQIREDKKREEETRGEERKKETTSSALPAGSSTDVVISEPKPKTRGKRAIQPRYQVATGFPIGSPAYLLLAEDFKALPDLDAILAELNDTLRLQVPEGFTFGTLRGKVRGRLANYLQQFEGRWGRYHPSRFQPPAPHPEFREVALDVSEPATVEPEWKPALVAFEKWGRDDQV